MRDAGARGVLRLPRPPEPARRPADTAIEVLAGPREDVAAALDALADALGAPEAAPAPMPRGRSCPTARWTRPRSAPRSAALLPEGAIVVDESVTASAPIVAAPRRRRAARLAHAHGRRDRPGPARRHGRRVAAPGPPGAQPGGRRLGDVHDPGLWTQAREGLDVTTVILANRSYAILDFELSRVGAERRRAARRRRAVRDRRPGPRLRRDRRGHGRAGRARRGRARVHGRAARGPRGAWAPTDRGAGLGGLGRQRQHRQQPTTRRRAATPARSRGACRAWGRCRRRSRRRRPRRRSSGRGRTSRRARRGGGGTSACSPDRLGRRRT